MNPELSLSAATITDIQSILKANGSGLAGSGLKAVTALVETLEAGLRGELGHHYYLSAMDPGMGKTLAIARFLKVWRDRGYQPSSSVIIGVSRRQEIESYLKASGLLQDEVAVLTSDPTWNALGVSKEHHGEARVLFTTQQMIESRTRGRSFDSVVEFNYQSEPRPLRIWDESLVPAAAEVLNVNDLGLIPSALSHAQRRKYPELQKRIPQFQVDLDGAAINRPVLVPADLAVQGLQLKGHPGAAAALRGLIAFAGKEALLVGNDRDGLALVGSSRTLPDDFAPVVIVDASGRVRDTYRLWEAHRGNLKRLPAAQNDFSNLTIHLWQRGSGKTALQDPRDRSAIVNAVAAEMMSDAGEWLVIHYKDSLETFTELKAAIGDREDITLHSLTWGSHHGTNRYSHVSNVVVIGQLWRPTHLYPALACAASGLAAMDVGKIDVDGLIWGEFQHDLLQALCRASVRRSVNGKAGRCRAYVIATPGAQTHDRIASTFPGCNLWHWRPADRRRGRLGEAIAYLGDRFANAEVTTVSKKEVRQQLGMAASNFSNDVIKHRDFQAFLGKSGIEANGRCFEKVRAHFEPWPDGGFVWDGADPAVKN